MAQQLIATRYELLEQIGQGGVAVVYRARDMRLGRVVALKVLRDQYVADPEFVARFEREAHIAASLNHPNIVGVHDYGAHGDSAFIAMDFVDGLTLKEAIRRRGRIPLDEAVTIQRAVLAGLAYLHDRGVVHRDVKPHNVLIGRDGTVKLTDFGIASVAEAAGLTQTGRTIGSAIYMAPEQATHSHVGPPADLYSAGLVFYEMLVGHPPFEGDAIVQVLYRQLNEQPRLPGALGIAVPPSVDAWLDRALAKAPADRFPNARVMDQALVEATSGPVGAPAPGAYEEVTRVVRPTATPVQTGPRVVPAPSAPASRRRWSALLAVGAFILAALTVGALAWGASRREEVLGQQATPGSISSVIPNGAIAVASTTADPSATAEPRRTPSAFATVQGGAASTPLATATPQATATLPPPAATATPPPSPTRPPPTPTRVPPTPTRSAPTATPLPSKPVAPTQGEVALQDSTFSGGYRNAGESLYRGRSATWAYGSGTSYSTMTARFTLEGQPGAATLVIIGMTSENWRPEVRITLNDRELFRGPSPFPMDQPGGDVFTDPGNWGEWTVQVPTGALHAGTNTLTIQNLEPVAAINQPPWVMVDRAVVRLAS